MIPHTRWQEAEDAAASLPSLYLHAQKLVSNLTFGHHGRRKSGRGEDFWQFKQYAEGESRTDIDWRQSAKRGEPFVRQRELETTENMVFWMDHSETMNYRSDPKLMTKKAYAQLICLAIAFLLERSDEEYCLLGSMEKISRGNAHLKNLALALNTNPNLALHQSLRQIPPAKKTSPIIFSDYLFPISELEKSVSSISKNTSSGLLLHFIDPAEIEFPFSGRTLFSDMKDLHSVLFGKAEKVRDEYLEKFQAHKSAVEATARKYGWTCKSVRTDLSPRIALTQIFMLLQRTD